MAQEKSPAFQFYPKDFLTDERVQRMSHTERGIYITLLCSCWLEGSLPLETGAVAAMLNLPLKRFTKLWENSQVRQCFQLQEDGRLHHKRLDVERAKQDKYRSRQSDAASVRWDKKAHATALPVQCPREEDRREKTLESLEREPERKPPEDDRPRWLLDTYKQVWYPRFRHGAKLRLIHGPMEFQDAQVLCETWDDAQLEKLAQIILTTNEEFIAGTDRSFKIFAIKASWADNRLKEAESGAA